MRRIFVILMGMALAAWLIEPGGAATPPVEAENSAVCSLSFVEYFSPGLSLSTPHTLSQNSGGEVGSIVCNGKLQGRTVTGPGTIGNEGFAHANCLVDHSWGRYFATVPTDSGPLHFEGTYDLERVGLFLTIEVEQPGAYGTGWAFILPTKGNCALAPVTEAQVYMTLSFRDSSDLVAFSRECDLDVGIVRVNCRTRASAS